MIDLGVDEIAELRLAVEELCIDARGHAHTEDPRVRLRLEWDHGSIWASCIVADGTPSLAREADVSTFSEQIISALVEEHGVEVTDGVRRSWLRIKRASR